MKSYWGVEVQFHVFLTSALDGCEWSASRAGRFTPKERDPGTHWVGGWVDSSAGLDAVVKRKIPSPCRDSNLRSSRPSLSAIPLSYPGSNATLHGVTAQKTVTSFVTAVKTSNLAYSHTNGREYSGMSMDTLSFILLPYNPFFHGLNSGRWYSHNILGFYSESIRFDSRQVYLYSGRNFSMFISVSTA
jgi:hypothetical protein